MDFQNLSPVRLYCPNCGTIVTGYKSDDGAVRIDCPKCRVKIFSKQQNKKTINLKLTTTK